MQFSQNSEARFVVVLFFSISIGKGKKKGVGHKKKKRENKKLTEDKGS